MMPVMVMVIVMIAVIFAMARVVSAEATVKP